MGNLSCGGRLHFQVCFRPLEDQSESWWSSCRLCFRNLIWSTRLLLTLSTLQTSETLYDWLIEHQQPLEILYHSPGLYFPFLLKFLLTHSPRAFKSSLIPFRALDLIRAICVQYSGPALWKDSADSSQVMLFWRYWSLLSIRNHLPLQGYSHPSHRHIFELHGDKSTPSLRPPLSLKF